MSLALICRRLGEIQRKEDGSSPGPSVRKSLELSDDSRLSFRHSRMEYSSYSGYGQSSWDGSLVSLHSSTYSTRPSSPAEARDPSTDPTSIAPLVPTLPIAHSLSNSSESLPASSQPSSSPSPPHATPSTPPPILPSLPSSHPNPPIPLDPPHPLASFLLASLSPPTSPTSLASFSRSESIEPGSPRSRGRSSTNGSGRGRDGELVMPSMRLDSPRRERREWARVLLLGKTGEERRGLARLLGERGDGGMEESFWLGRLGERGRGEGGEGAMLEELKYATGTMAFYHPASGVEIDALASAFLVPLERMEAMLDSTFPSTQSLANLVTEGARDELEACLFLFSSRVFLSSSRAVPQLIFICAAPTHSEVVAARTISQLLPLFPILLLPPSPTSKPQKTAALVHAVSQQLTSAGVRWTSAFGTLEDGKRSPIYVLPSELFTFHDGSESSGPSSLASSLELPRSPTFSTRSASPLPPSGDLARLRSLVRSSSAREQIRRNRTTAFLEWREVEVAARGGTLLEIDQLPSEWGEKAVEEGEKKAQLQLDFSKRVAERRAVLEAKRVEEAGSQEARSEGGDDDGHLHLSTSTSSLSDLLLRRSSLADPTTPRCSQRPSSLPSSQSSAQSNPDEMDIAGSYFPSPPPYPTSHPSLLESDPFHLPSLLTLVGVNFRLALLPPPATGQAEKQRRGVAGWVGTAALLSAVFLAGMVCGGGRVGGVWREVWRGGVRVARM